MPLRRAPVDTVNQPGELRRRQRQRFASLDVQGPKKDAVLEPLGEKTKPAAVPEQNLEKFGPAAPERKQMSGEWILPQHALDQHGEPIDAFAHVGIAESQMHLHPRRKQRHDASPLLPDASDEVPSSVICTATNPGATRSCFQRNTTRAAIP